jgi:hypothetical protein
VVVVDGSAFVAPPANGDSLGFLDQEWSHSGIPRGQILPVVEENLLEFLPGEDGGIFKNGIDAPDAQRVFDVIRFEFFAGEFGADLLENGSEIPIAHQVGTVVKGSDLESFLPDNRDVRIA